MEFIHSLNPCRRPLWRWTDTSELVLLIPIATGNPPKFPPGLTLQLHAKMDVYDWLSAACVWGIYCKLHSLVSVNLPHSNPMKWLKHIETISQSQPINHPKARHWPSRFSRHLLDHFLGAGPHKMFTHCRTPNLNVQFNFSKYLGETLISISSVVQ